MAPTIRPNITPGSHPIDDCSSSYIIPTATIYELIETIHHWVNIRATGGIIFGHQRVGKTYAVRYIRAELQDLFSQEFSTFFIPQISSVNTSETVFFSHWLKYVGHSLHTSGTGYIKRQRLLNFLAEKGKQTKRKIVVLIVDEAQLLNETHYQWLVELGNELEEERILTTIILVGQPELGLLRNAFEVAGKMQFIGRFMVREFRFFGLRNIQDIYTCLHGYDEDSEYPPGTGCSYSRYFFPEAFDLGWRLAYESEKIWETFSEVRKVHKQRVLDEIPMEYFSRTIEILFKEYSDLTTQFSGFTIAQIRKAVQESGYLLGSRYLISPENFSNFEQK